MVATDTLAQGAPRRQPATPSLSASGGATLALPVKIYLLAIMIPIAFFAGPLYLNSLRVVLLIFIVPMVFQLLSGKMGKIIPSDILFFLYVAWNTLSTAVNNPESVVQNVGSTSVEFLGGYLIARRYIQSRGEFIALCKWISMLAILTLPFALMESQTGRPLIIDFIRSLPGLTSETPITIPKRMGLERVQLVFAHPIHYGLFCSIAFSLTYVALEGVYSGMRRTLVSIGIGMCVFFSLSSGALLAMVLQVGMITWYFMFRNVARRWLILFLLFAFAYIAVDILSTRSPIKVFMTYATFSSHNAYWRGIIFEWGIKNIFGDASNGVVGSPIFGIGLNDWVRPPYMFSGSMDNFWLVIGVRNGAPGFALLAIGYVHLIIKIAQRNFDSDKGLTTLRRAWLFSFMGLTFTLCTVHIWTSIFSFVFFLFGAGAWFLAATPEAETDGTAPPDDEGSRGRASSRKGPRPQESAGGGSHYTRFAPSANKRAATEPTQKTSSRASPKTSPRPTVRRPSGGPSGSLSGGSYRRPTRKP